jgi:hypothetical protein
MKIIFDYVDGRASESGGVPVDRLTRRLSMTEEPSG